MWKRLDPRQIPGRFRRISRQFRVAVIPITAYVRSRAFLSGLIVLAAVSLIVIHGYSQIGFTVDEITLGLLVFASIPALSQLVTSFKAGAVEVAFRDLAVNDQLIAFLDGIATKRQWTFFTPRPGEEYLGPAFRILTEQLLRGSRDRLVSQLRTWLASDDVNQRWFAAEIVGYHKIGELRQAVGRAPESWDRNDEWDTWELNCIWARSRFDEEERHKTLRDFFVQTTNVENRTWILMAFEQMLAAGLDDADTIRMIVSEFAEQLKREGVKREKMLQAYFKDVPLLRELVGLTASSTPLQQTS